ncbi:hypothetical protein SEPCBS119000_002632 [Sporothrix epigloea]|uniref:Alpha/beta hydrolase fold-3 domain-containing protein n=1 Tax=Sporothrix epigloea TaxID=1892477 RepID=A0ABP0DIX1_9PEZI
MCDFSRYGGASREWMAVEAASPTPPPFGSLILDVMRGAVNAEREAAAAKLLPTFADQVELIDVTIPARDGFALPGRLYWPTVVARSSPSPSPSSSTTTAGPAIYMHLHGGGYFFGSLSSEDAICAGLAVETAAKTPVVVLNLNYRHTPEHAYPTAWHDVQDALAWIHAVAVPEYGVDPARVVVGGISAGAHLAASLVLEQHLGRLPQPVPAIAGQVLIIPTVVHHRCYDGQLAQLTSPKVSSFVENEFAPLLPMSMITFFTDLLHIEPEELGPDNLLLCPGNVAAEKARGLPPTVFGVCGLDPLRDEGLLYAKLLAERAGVPTDVHLYRGVPHGFHEFGVDKLSVVRDWNATMINGITWALSKPAASNKLDIQVHGEQTM